MRTGRGRYVFSNHVVGLFDSWWVEASVRELWGSKKVRRLFNLFKELFPDHPSPDNTFLVLLWKGSDVAGRYWAYWLCRHFECGSSEHLAGLAWFMEELKYKLGGAWAELAFLCTIEEKLMIEVKVEDPTKLPKKLLGALKQVMRTGKVDVDYSSVKKLMEAEE